MKEIDIKELRQIQVDILSAVANYCERESLRYFLGYGTLIGAIRHHGYIPWDDDIDIIMPRPDYNRFLKDFNSKYDWVKVTEKTISSKYELPFAKVYDSRTELIEGMYKPNCQFGVYIDVFPIDGYKERWTVLKIRMLAKFLNTKKAIIDNRRSWIKTIVITIGKLFLLPFPVSKIIDKMDRLATKYDYDSSEMVDSMFTPYCLHEMCPKEWLNNFIMAEFEGQKYRIPECYDMYLKNIYGDYMSLPPVDKQVAHHVFKAWWK